MFSKYKKWKLNYTKCFWSFYWLIVVLYQTSCHKREIPNHYRTTVFRETHPTPFPTPRGLFPLISLFFFWKNNKKLKTTWRTEFPCFQLLKNLRRSRSSLEVEFSRGKRHWELVNSEVDRESISRGLQRLTSRHLKVPQDQRSNFARVFEENLNLICIVINFIDIYQKCFTVLEHQ